MQMLKEKWEVLQKENPRLRIRDAAVELGVSEMELLATKLERDVYFLGENFKEIFSRIPSLGYVMALTRNESCVHERKGEYGKVQINGNMGLVVGEDIDLRVFFHSWKYVFAEKVGEKRSLQFFDVHGEAVHKVHLNEKSNSMEFDNILKEFVTKDLNFFVEPKKKSEKEKVSLSSEAIEDFLQEWANLKDTHDFFNLLKKYNVERTHALQLAEGKFTKKLKNENVPSLLQLASKTDTPIMVFVGNPGMIQIHTGEVKNIQEVGVWVNVMDEKFNLHLRQDLISEIWHAVKPTTDGDVNSIEVFDANGELIVQFFGKRKPGNPEREDWRKLISEL